MVQDQKDPMWNTKIPAKSHIPSWRAMHMDTTPEVEAVLFRLYRDTPAWRKLELMEDLNRTARQLALMGLRDRYPDATEKELRRLLAGLLLGEELAQKVYGPLPNSKSND